MRFPDRWDSLDYLAHGTPRQQEAYAALQQGQVMEHLAPWHPLLAGTIPLGIDVEGSDLDILCEVWEFEPFLACLRDSFGHLPGFAARQKESGGLPVVVARFESGPFLVEVFGQSRLVSEQNGYRHMVVEARLLALAGPEAAGEIKRLKAAGLKTEPAFGRYLGLPGDPYHALLALYDAGEPELRRIINSRSA